MQNRQAIALMPVATTTPELGTKVAAAAVFISSVAVLGVAFYLTPRADGLGTHTGLGLPACGLYQTTGMPCATCGMTTAFSYAAQGDLIASFVTQPAGALLAILTAMAAVVSGYALVAGISLAPMGKLLWRPRVVIIAATVLLSAWVYKIVILSGLIGVST